MERTNSRTWPSTPVVEGKSYPGLRQALLLCLLYFAVQSGFHLPFAISDSAFETEWMLHPGLTAVGLLVAGALTMAAAFRIGRPPARAVLAFRRVSAGVLAAASVAIAGFVILASELDNLLNRVLPMPKSMADTFQQMFGPERHPVWALVALAVAAPLVEELLFRGLILRGLLGRHSAPRAILAAAVLFGAIHLNPWQGVPAVVVGVLLGWFYVRTRSLLPAMLGHAAMNVASYSVAFLPFRIQGFNPAGVTTPGVFQPWWFDALGVGILAVGIWAFARATRGRPTVARLTAPAVAANAVAAPAE